jgi:hypothetical protein
VATNRWSSRSASRRPRLDLRRSASGRAKAAAARAEARARARARPTVSLRGGRNSGKLNYHRS